MSLHGCREFQAIQTHVGVYSCGIHVHSIHKVWILSSISGFKSKAHMIGRIVATPERSIHATKSLSNFLVKKNAKFTIKNFTYEEILIINI